MLYISERLSLSKNKPKGRISQNGVKYRTLCVGCNSGLLGTEYDPAFISYVNSLGAILKSELLLPGVLSIRAKPQRIMRSLLGHLSAQGVNRYEEESYADAIREYFQDTSRALPSGLKIYTWAYPYRGYVMARDCALLPHGAENGVRIWFLKFFPVGFLVTFNEPPEHTFDFIELSEWRNSAIDEEVEIPIVLHSLAHEFWPEAPTRNTSVMYGQDAITSFNWRKMR